MLIVPELCSPLVEVYLKPLLGYGNGNFRGFYWKIAAFMSVIPHLLYTYILISCGRGFTNQGVHCGSFKIRR